MWYTKNRRREHYYLKSKTALWKACFSLACPRLAFILQTSWLRLVSRIVPFSSSNGARESERKKRFQTLNSGSCLGFEIAGRLARSAILFYYLLCSSGCQSRASRSSVFIMYLPRFPALFAGNIPSLHHRLTALGVVSKISATSITDKYFLVLTLISTTR